MTEHKMYKRIELMYHIQAEGHTFTWFLEINMLFEVITTHKLQAYI